MTAPTPAALTATFARLKLALLVNGLRQSSGRRALYLASLVLALLFAAAQIFGLVLLRGHEDATVVVVLLAGVVSLGWAVMPLFLATGGDETLDPTRLAMLPLDPRTLVRALLAASLVGIGPLYTLCVLLGSVIAVAYGPAAWTTAVVAVPLTLVVCVALARAVATANTRLLTSRRGRDLAVLSGLLIAIGAQLVSFGAQSLGRAGDLEALRPLEAVLRWVPPASAIGAVDSAARGSYGAAVAQLVLTGLLLLLLLAWWRGTLVRLMTSPDASTVAAAGPGRKGRSGHGATGPRWLPGGRTGTVMERSLRYMRRDPKTRGALVIALAIGLIVPVFNALQGRGTIYLACCAPAMLGTVMYNQFGQDHSGFWMVLQTIGSPRDASLELRGRALALSLVAVPHSILTVIVTALMLGDMTTVPESIGLTCAFLGSVLGTGAVASVRAPYSIPQEGRKNIVPGQGTIAALSIFGGMIAGVLLCTPVIALTVWLHASGQPLFWLLLPVGAAWGLLTSCAGLRVAAPQAAARLPEILTAVSKG
ncbi:transporter [Streptomyces sp. NPDC003032]